MSFEKASDQKCLDTEPEDWRKECDLKLAELTSLTKNWDGYSGEVVTELAVTRCKAFLETAMSTLKRPILPDLVPMNDGGIQIEWHRLSGDLELAINGSSGDCDLYVKTRIFFGGERGGGLSNFEGKSHDERAREMFKNFAPLFADPDINQISC